MTSHHASHVGIPFGRNPALRWMAAIYGAAWTLAAIAPVDRPTWLLENAIVFAAAGGLIASHRRFVFSNLSYALIGVFLVLHVVGAHYTYSEVPLGNWLRDALGLARNHYDRVVHFTFGLLLTYPVRELVLRALHVHRFGSYALPVLVILACSAAYEIIESWAARIVSPEVGIAYIGAQGDVWDHQKDMSLALGGALAAMAITACIRRSTGREPYLAPIGRADDAA